MCRLIHLTLLFLLFIFNQTIAQETLHWQFFHPIKKVMVEAGTHASVQEKLIDTGELPDPFFGKNENLFGWIEKEKWEFYSSILLTKEMQQKDFVQIEFPGIDTYAEIFLNDSLIGFAQNAFRPYYFEVKNLLKIGKNKLKVVFFPPIIYHEKAYKSASYKLPAPNDVNEIAIASYSRKPQYQFGWDWSLRMNTIGFLKPVKVNCYNTAKAIGKNSIVTNLTENAAEMRFQIQLSSARKAGKIRWESDLFGTQILESSDKLERLETVLKPNLWWPRGQGEQFLYTDTWKLFSENGVLIDSMHVRFGIKKSELLQEKDKWGTGYVIKINGRPVFCKGADYIPQDIFPARVTDADLKKMVETMAQSNFNMVRIWGGGYYPDAAFYETCDALGIMVWQDFMFACAMYPGDSNFLQQVKEEIEFQIPRISSHPSLVIFNGNNEVDVAWKNWGFQLKYSLYGKEAQEIEESYTKLFKQLIPKVVSELSTAPYIHTSPLSNWGKDVYYNEGTQHYWGVWHGKDPLSDFGKKIGRFNAEYGFQSFPEYSTLSTFSEKKDWNLESDIMKHHQKSYVGNGMILKHAKLLYGDPTNFETFVYYSQLTQATAVSMAVTGHRLDAPRCMGTLYWQLNDCWPAPSWSSVDYFGNWKALQYKIKDDYESIAVLRKNIVDGQSEYFLVSDQIDTFYCALSYTVFDLSGKELFSKSISQLVKGNGATKICITGLKKNYNIRFNWKDVKNENKSRVFSETPIAYKKAEASDVKLYMTDIDLASKSAVLHIENKKFLKDFWLYSSKLGIRFERNFMDLLPGNHAIKIQFEETPILEDFAMKWL